MLQGKLSTMSEILEELDAWLADNWDSELSVAAWWQRLGSSGWAAPALPTNAYGKGFARNDAIAVGHRIVAHGAVAAPGGLGMSNRSAANWLTSLCMS